jgi:hypothetical protein
VAPEYLSNTGALREVETHSPPINKSVRIFAPPVWLIEAERFLGQRDQRTSDGLHAVQPNYPI